MFKRVSNHFSLIRSLLSVACLLSVASPLSLHAQDGNTVYLPVILTSNVVRVTTTVDELNTDGDCSLREAIQAVNLGVGVDACRAGDALTIIELPPGVYTLTLTGANEDDNTTGDLDILTSVTINGSGATSTVIDGNRSDRVMQVHADAAVVINNLTIRNGKAPNGADTEAGGSDAQAGQNGGGIANAGVLSINASVITGNSAGNQSTKVSSDKETAAPAPNIERIDAFLKKDTTLKESDVIVIYIRNVAYDERANAFKEDFKVYLDDKEQAFHDVNPVGADYQAITVDISGITAGSVYVTYGELKSNSMTFTMK